MIESWMITLAGAVLTFIVTFVTMKNRQDTQSKKQENTEEIIEKIFKRLDAHGDDIVKLNTKSELAMTAKDVDDKYVSKELFRQFEKHIDKRFDRIEEGQGKILRYIEDTSKRVG